MVDIIIKPSRFLSKNEFRNYLELVRKIARFDNINKVWRVDKRIIRRNFSNLSDVYRLISQLLAYSTIVPSEEELYEYVRRILSDAIFDLSTLTLKVNKKLSDELYAEISKYSRYLGKRCFKLKSIIYIDKIINLFKRENISFYPNEEEIRKIKDKLLYCEITRRNGNLVIKLPIIDEYLIDRLKKACSIKYFVERVLFDENGNFLDTIREEKYLRVYKLNFEKGEFITSVGLLHKICEKLNEIGFRIYANIKEKDDIPYSMSVKFELLPHQKIAYKLWLQKKRGTIAIFTRGGKSFIALRAIADLRKPSIILVTTKELANTWRRYLIDYLGLHEHQIGYLGEGNKNIKPITIAIYNSCVKYIDLIRDKFELLICDESHHVPANTFKEIVINMDSLYRLALSATPKRRDGNEELLYQLCGPLLVNIDYKRLLELRIVAPIEIFETKFVVGEEEKLDELVKILKKHKNEKTIIFTQYKKTVKKIFNHLIRNGFNVALITGDTPSFRRKRAFDDFLKGRVPIIITTTVLDEGITVPDAEVAIIYENSGEARQLIQRIGRVLGYLPGKTAKVYEIVDISNPKEKKAYFKRKWVKEMYLFPELKEFVRKEKEGIGKVGKLKFSYQARLDVI